MLVITRKPQESFSFPALGIKIEVGSISPSTAKICIQAPVEFRIVRSELPLRPSDFEIAPTVAKHLGRNGQQLYELSQTEAKPAMEQSSLQIDRLQRQLDAANLALHLAQNQIRATENHAADENLSTALELLMQIELQLASHPDWQQAATSTLREAQAGYATTPGVWWVAEQGRLHDGAKDDSKSSFFETDHILQKLKTEFGQVATLNTSELIERLQSDAKGPDRLLIANPHPVGAGMIDPIELAGIRSLKHEGTRQIGGVSVETWSR
jgi:sRNA-binding carbon storage regulator CsrA